MYYKNYILTTAAGNLNVQFLHSNALFLWQQEDTRSLRLLSDERSGQKMHTSVLQLTTSRQDTETTLHHSVMQNTGTLLNSANIFGILTTLFHRVSFHLAHPTACSSKRCNLCVREKFFIIF